MFMDVILLILLPLSLAIPWVFPKFYNGKLLWLNDGIVEVLVTNGGTPPYQYSDDGGLTYQSSNTFYNLSPGNHTFTVLDNNGCSNDITTLITQPLELGVDVIFTNLQCFNDCDATATAIVDNGTQPYSYGGQIQVNN